MKLFVNSPPQDPIRSQVVSYLSIALGKVAPAN